jgi:hypothetical protein
MNNYDIITTTDKAKRDDIFRQMRESTDPLERASVKFSGNEIVPDEFGEGGSDGKFIQYSVSGSGIPRNAVIPTKKGGVHILNLGPKQQWRPKYISTWSVATPRPRQGY